MATRLLAAAVLLLAPAGALAAQAFLGAGRGGPPEGAQGASPRGSAASGAGRDGALARKEADPRTKKEQELQMLEAVLESLDAEGEPTVSDISRRLAAIASRRAERGQPGRPARAERRGRKPAQVAAPEQALGPESGGHLSTSWGVEEASAPGLTGGSSPEVGTEAPATQERIAAEARRAEAASAARAREAQAQAFSDLAGALARVEGRPTRRAAGHPSQGSAGAGPSSAEAVGAWRAEALEASRGLEEAEGQEESDLGEAKPQGEEEGDPERVADLVDEADPRNASELADLAEALAQVERRPKRRAAGRPLRIPSVADADSKMVEALRVWMAESLERAIKDVRHGESDLDQGKPDAKEDNNLTAVDLTDEADPKNASELADIADARAHIQGRSSRAAARHGRQDLRSWVAKALEAMRGDGRHDEDKVLEAMMRKPRGGQSDTHAKVVDAIMSWMENLDEEADPETASELEELAAVIAQARSLQRRLKRRHEPEGEATENTTRLRPAPPTSAPNRAGSRPDAARRADRAAAVAGAAQLEPNTPEEPRKQHGPANRPAAAGGAIERADADTDAAS
ncbi:unnamed protein product [Prorocentrum cordatum]|uniref:Uncharacterized protein n=1 Tax=Prorocentrum cordatum TaxID=2364126 RepID=A0ABN9PP42_9DINO|nr:unnamed protein product [Polarella glacialis]